MTVGGPVNKRFTPERLFRAESVVVLGAGTAEGRRLLANAAAAGFRGRLFAVAPADAALPPGIEPVPGMAGLPAPADFAVVASEPARIAADLREVAAARITGAVVLGACSGLDALAAELGIRIIGPNSFGIAVPGIGLNVSLSHIQPPAGRMALVTQSSSLARAVLDWAGPNGVGFSHIVGLGGNADFGFSAVLDWLSRDPSTGLILFDIRRIRRPRMVLSAARAASRLRPVVALRPGSRLLDPTGEGEAVFAAALRRAGVFMVVSFEEFLAAAETLTRSRPPRADAVAIVTNAIGPGRLAADAALRSGIRVASLPPEARTSLAASLPAELIQGLIYTGSSEPTRVAELAAMLSAVPEVGGVLTLLAPTGPADAAAVEAVIAAASSSRLPLLCCVMGETTGAAHRQRLASAGLPAFATPERAIEGFHHLLRVRQARLSAAELPTSRVLDVAPDLDAARAAVAAARAAGSDELSPDAAARLLGAFGIRMGPAPGEGEMVAWVRVQDDPMLGPALGFGLHGRQAQPAFDLPPLNVALAQSLARAAGIATEPETDAAVQVLVRVSQMLVDLPEIAVLVLDPVRLGPGGAAVAAARVRLRPPGQRGELAIPPYPDRLIGRWSNGGVTYTIRPIRPEDAEAHTRFIRRIPADDLRYRFFYVVRSIPAEQIARLTQIDYDREIAFVAQRDSDGEIVGVSRLVREGEEGGEFAILVAPEMKGTGLAAHLMQRLIDWARQAGLREITGSVLAENQPMLRFVRRLGFAIRHPPDEAGVVEAVLTL